MIYLSVSYDQKDDAKAMGAKWDPQKKLWYAPDSSFTKLIETYEPLVGKEKKVYNVRKLETNESLNQMGLTRNVFLLGEDRTYGGDQLFVDLLPKDSSITLKRTLEDSEYSKLRNIVVKRVAYKCEICNTECLSKDNKYLQICERFSYCMETKVQKLERIVAMCKECFQTARLLDKGIALTRLIEINQTDKEDAKQHIFDAYEIWKVRSNIKWTVDLSIISNFSNGSNSSSTEKSKIKINKLDTSTKNIVKDIDTSTTNTKQISSTKINKLDTSTKNVVKDIDTNTTKISNVKITIHKLDSKKEMCLIDDE